MIPHSTGHDSAPVANIGFSAAVAERKEGRKYNFNYFNQHSLTLWSLRMESIKRHKSNFYKWGSTSPTRFLHQEKGSGVLRDVRGAQGCSRMLRDAQGCSECPRQDRMQRKGPACLFHVNTFGMYPWITESQTGWIVFPIKWLGKIPSKEQERPPCFSCAIFSHAIPEARHEIRETLCWYHLMSHSPSNSEHKKHNIRTSCAFSLAPAYVFVVKKKNKKSLVWDSGQTLK